MDLRRLRWSSEELCSSHPPPAWGWVVRQLVTIRGWAKQKSLMVGCHRAVRIWLQRRSWWRLPSLKNCFYFAGWILETGCCRISVAAIKKPVIVWLLLADHTRGQWTEHRVRDCDFYKPKCQRKLSPNQLHEDSIFKYMSSKWKGWQRDKILDDDLLRWLGPALNVTVRIWVASLPQHWGLSRKITLGFALRCLLTKEPSSKNFGTSLV